MPPPGPDGRAHGLEHAPGDLAADASRKVPQAMRFAAPALKIERDLPFLPTVVFLGRRGLGQALAVARDRCHHAAVEQQPRAPDVTFARLPAAPVESRPVLHKEDDLVVGEGELGHDPPSSRLLRGPGALAGDLHPAQAHGEAEDRPQEDAIDARQATLPPLKAFILPGGSPAGALLHFARTVCRRAERRVVALARHEAVDPLVVAYLNRLSDLLFVLARDANRTAGVAEDTW
jgi:hypothetical protein